MSLAEGKALSKELIEVNETDFVETSAAIEKWQHFPASVISHHGAACCRLAHEWMMAMDFSQLNAGHPLTGPRWLRQKFSWGPSRWPIYWCEAVQEKTLDCGALAALSQEVFRARGVKSFPAQFIEQFSEDAARQWYRKWEGDESSIHWIKEDLIYHEGCAVLVRDDEIRIWDSTASWWVNPKQFGGYGGLLVLRVFADEKESPASFSWGTHRIIPNRWHKIERARGDFA
ncbi:MAG TPA: hypothetical protein VGB17_10235 [Pyrinomonadaceae bacterium]|jgi:hypothetical protein